MNAYHRCVGNILSIVKSTVAEAAKIHVCRESLIYFPEELGSRRPMNVGWTLYMQGLDTNFYSKHSTEWNSAAHRILDKHHNEPNNTE